MVKQEAELRGKGSRRATDIKYCIESPRENLSSDERRNAGWRFQYARVSAAVGPGMSPVSGPGCLGLWVDIRVPQLHKWDHRWDGWMRGLVRGTLVRFASRLSSPFGAALAHVPSLLRHDHPHPSVAVPVAWAVRVAKLSHVAASCSDHRHFHISHGT